MVTFFAFTEPKNASLQPRMFRVGAIFWFYLLKDSITKSLHNFISKKKLKNA